VGPGVHPFKALKDIEINLSQAEFLEVCESWLTVTAEDWAGGCIPQDGSTKSHLLKCRCMRVISDKVFGKETKRAVANWMLRYGGLNNEKQQMQIIAWIKHRRQRDKDYRLPFYVSDDGGVTEETLKHLQSIRLCWHSLQIITDFKKDKWAKVAAHAVAGTVPVDGRKGNTNRHEGFVKIHDKPRKDNSETLKQNSATRATAGKRAKMKDNDMLYCRKRKLKNVGAKDGAKKGKNHNNSEDKNSADSEEPAVRH
jgi:hypothetical protein